MLSITMNPKLVDQIDAYCKEKELNRSECIEQFLHLIFNIDGWVASVKEEGISDRYEMVEKKYLKSLQTMVALLTKVQEVEVTT